MFFTTFRTRGVAAALAGVLTATWATIASAQGVNPIALSIGQATANRGDTALVSIELQVGNTRPTNMVVWLRYDPTKIQPDVNAFEFIARDLAGNPILDNQGQVITSHGAVRREQAVIDAGKQVEAEVHAEGALGIAVQGLNDATIAPGLILTVAFKVQNGVAENEVVDIEGAESTDPVQFTDGGELQTAFSSAHYQGANDQQGDLSVEVSDGRITVPCTTPNAPTAVTATQGQPDAVVVSWTASTSPNVQYRVYRALTNDAAAAQPLGTGPQAATTFSDITALAPIQPSTGCACNAQATITHYFYFVRAVAPSGCESEFSTPGAEGFRGTAQAASAKAATVLDTLPATSAGVNIAYAGQAVAVRLEGVAPGTIWAQASASGWSSDRVRWVADTTGGGWAAIDLPASLAAGSQVLLSAGAQGVGPVVREFVVAAAPKSGAALSVTDLGDAAVPYLPEGVGSVYQVAPASLLATPATVYLPVPAGESAADLVVFTYIAAQGDRRWYLGENVGGWLAAAPTIVKVNGQDHVRIDVRYGGIVQLGYAPTAGTQQQASLTPADLAKLHAGDAALLLLLTAVFLGARHRKA